MDFVDSLFQKSSMDKENKEVVFFQEWIFFRKFCWWM